MKYFKAIISIMLVLLLLSGCSFRISSSVDDLISPLSPYGDNAEVKEALDSFVTNGYTLKMPNGGSYISSYNFYDIDNDGTEEAIAFYEPSDNLGTIDLAMIKKAGKEWKVVCNVTGTGKDVHALDFAQLYGSEAKEIIVCWDVISNSVNHELSVYQYDASASEPTLKLLDENKTVSDFAVCDMLSGGLSELLLLTNNSGSSSSPKAALYSLEGATFHLLGETKLDARIASFVSLQKEKYNASERVYADAINSDGSLMITELIYWSDEYDTIISPFYSYSAGRTEDTTRSALLSSLDVDGDRMLEIPRDYSLKRLPKEVAAVELTDYRHAILIHNAYALFVENDKYIFILPDELISAVSVHYSPKTREMTLKNKVTKKTVVTLMPVLKATYNDEKYPGYKKILEASGYCYLAKSGPDEAIRLSDNEIKNSIKSIE